MEKLILNVLNWYLEDRNLIVNEQAGFRKNRSTTDQVTYLSQIVKNALDNRNILTTVYNNLKARGACEKIFEASLKGKNLGYQPLKARLIAQFSKPVNFVSNFTQFATTVQLPSERVKDFASRLEEVGLPLRALGRVQWRVGICPKN
ncbi:hypothetical protein CEXT_126581 [Caerostris extrusa]|uniref:Reverse transcriptase domain-containing protein n=1 Tax=Caerostris extrusa TaxID=172846 RepID=A0AAV4P033_CAEEX|nr:hypothetical protein CEXT_126581 [Caerostris extrusa]